MSNALCSLTFQWHNPHSNALEIVETARAHSALVPRIGETVGFSRSTASLQDILTKWEVVSVHYMLDVDDAPHALPVEALQKVLVCVKHAV